MSKHNITGLEAGESFSPAHGSIRMFPRRTRWPGALLIGMLIGAAALALALFLAVR